uniref:ribosomal protein L9 n=1 Tax=Anunuuluaehu liula TaxID=3049639 RepID=UPI003003A692
MKKNRKIIIQNTHNKLGQKGDIVKVASGYAFNYLIPNNFAELATKGKLKHTQMLKYIQDKKLIESKIDAHKIQEKLQNISKISIIKTIGAKQQIFGKINEKEILAKISYYAGQKLEKKQIFLPSIKKLGIYEIDIQIFNNINSKIQLQVLPQYLKIHI